MKKRIMTFISWAAISVVPGVTFATATAKMGDVVRDSSFIVVGLSNATDPVVAHKEALAAAEQCAGEYLDGIHLSSSEYYHFSEQTRDGVEEEIHSSSEMGIHRETAGNTLIKYDILASGRDGSGQFYVKIRVGSDVYRNTAILAERISLIDKGLNSFTCSLNFKMCKQFSELLATPEKQQFFSKKSPYFLKIGAETVQMPAASSGPVDLVVTTTVTVEGSKGPVFINRHKEYCRNVSDFTVYEGFPTLWDDNTAPEWERRYSKSMASQLNAVFRQIFGG